MHIQAKVAGRANTLALRRLLPLLLGASMAAISFSAPAQTTMTQSNQPAMNSETAKSGMSMDMRGSMMEMRKSMDAMKPSGDIDYDFAAMMRVHHQGAVDMAELELKKGQDPEMKQMAKEIIAAQKKEIAKFDEWLAAHPKPSK
ncbi:DUF305 domain-containing protein [Paracandidimonas lactea]|uniref:DUF305 domain-containing protein n=1 Tax=Paracandidimonas lactea TaxID=2895524 RepID=UPI001F289750|nr:DUF305 domain-containing protein [Paracandidimonas lactea]